MTEATTTLTRAEGEANYPVAGEYHAIALDLQGIGQAQISALKEKLEHTKAKLEQFQQNGNDRTSINNLANDDLSGDLLYSGILSYFASVDGSDQLAARSRGDIVNYRLPGYGTFMASASPHYWFGIVISVSFPGVTMDVDRVFYQAEAKDYEKAKRVAYLRQVGSAGSAFEHAVPEWLFADPNKAASDPSQPQGVSAVKAIAIAASQGQRIYTLNPANQTQHAAVLAQINIDADAKAEIRSALTAGKEVAVHQGEINVNGWTGSGYIIVDAETGAGAYKISGGANGGILILFLIAVVIAIVAPFVVFYLAGAGAALFAAALAGLNLSGLIQALSAFSFDQDHLTPEQREARLGVISLLSIAQSLLAIYNAPLQLFDKYIIQAALLAMVTIWTKLLNFI